MAGKYVNGKDMSAYDVLNPVAGKMDYPTHSILLDTALHNAKRKLGNRGMLKRNDAERQDLYSQGNALDQAMKARQSRWESIPDTARETGALMSLEAAQ